MRHGRVGPGVPAIGDDDALVASHFEEVLEIAADLLDRERVDGSVIAGSTDELDPDTAEDTRVVILQNVHQGVEEAKCLPSIPPRRSASHCPTEVRSLDFG